MSTLMEVYLGVAVLIVALMVRRVRKGSSPLGGRRRWRPWGR